MEQQAYALGLKLDELYNMTQREFFNIIEGYKLKQEREWEKTAQLASWIMSPHIKKPISAKKLLGRDSTQQPLKKVTPIEKQAIFDELENSIGIH